jgi:Rrf2 family nitric oxide-sensitive transcriptional repressor
VFEGNLHLLACVATDQVCSIESFCKLKGALAEAERVQLDYLNSVTLADVAPTRKQLTLLPAPSL